MGYHEVRPGNYLDKLKDRIVRAGDDEIQRILDEMAMHEEVEWIENDEGQYECFDPDDDTGRIAISSNWKKVYLDIFKEEEPTDSEEILRLEGELERWRKWAVSLCNSNTMSYKLAQASDTAKRSYISGRIEHLKGELDARGDELVAGSVLQPDESEYFVRMGEDGKPNHFAIFKKEKADKYLEDGKQVAPIVIGKPIDEFPEEDE